MANLPQMPNDVLMSRHTGKGINDEMDLVQSIGDILTTGIGTRTCVRDYGSNLPYLIDKPVNRDWVITAYSDIADSLTKWEPRFTLYLASIDATYVYQGIVLLGVEGLYRPLGRVIRLENITLNFQTAFTAVS